MFHNKNGVNDRPEELRTRINQALEDGALTTVEIAWHTATKGKYPTCAGEVGALLASDPAYTCNTHGEWRHTL
jgi:hypothetical protein